MSSKNRKKPSAKFDDYPTPAWCVERLLEAQWLPSGRWWEPTAGAGGIIEAVPNEDIWGELQWTACELQGKYRRKLAKLVGSAHVHIRDVIAKPLASRFDVAITNPPYTLASELWGLCRQRADWVCLLLRLGFLETERRRAFLAHDMPDVWVLPNRPSFDGKGTDSTTYGWFVWTPERRTEGRIRLLRSTPREERKR